MKATTLCAALLLLVGQPSSAQVAPMPNAAPVEEITVGGVVIDEATGEPVAQVAVFLAGETIGTLTSTDGTFVLHGVPNRNSLLRAQRLGYIPETRMIMVCAPDHFQPRECRPTAAEPQIVNFYLRTAPRSTFAPSFP